VKRWSHWVIAALCLHVGLCALSRADSFTTNIVSGVSTNAGAYLIIGNTGRLNYLEINSGGIVMSGDGEMGDAISASNNAALLTDPNSAWIAPTGVYIGETSAGNSLIISNGAFLSTGILSVIGDTWHGIGNLVIVTGSNTVWSNSGSLVVGNAGSGNQLQVLNGGQVLSNASVLMSMEPASSNNTIIVDGLNSQLIDNGTFVMGGYGPDNQFTLSGGARFVCNGASIDNGGNVVTVTGSNTLWNNDGPLLNGLLLFGVSRGTNNQIAISAGAVVNNSGVLIGGDTPASNNIVLVTDPHTLWQIKTYFYVSSPGNIITVTNEARVNSGGFVIDSDSRNANDPNILTIADNSVWSNTGPLFVGYYGAGNQLDIEGGSQLIGSTNITMGASYSYSSSNVITIAGQNSRLTDSGPFLVGAPDSGSGYNRVTIRDGGALINSGSTTIGYENPVGGNAISITGTGSVWSNGWTYIYSSSNTISVTDGAYLHGSTWIMSGSDNLILLSDPGTHLDGGFGIGSYGNTNNALIVSNGAALNGGFELDYGSKMTLTGTNTTCTDSGTLYMIYYDQMSILDGAQFLGNQFVYVIGSGCDINVAGNGARWGNIGQIYFVQGTDSNNLTIGIGGSVDAKQLWIAAGSSGPSNFVTVAGALTVTNGGTGQIQLWHGQIILQQGVVLTDQLSISAGTSVTGCGTIIGSINNSGTLAVTCPGGTLTLNGIVTNSATITATNNADIEFLGPVVNNGTIDVVNGYAHFSGGFINHGTYVDAGGVLKTPLLSFSGADVVVSFGCVSGKTYAVEYTDNLVSSNWLVLVGDILGNGGGTQFIDPGASSLTQRFYRVHLTLP
jgi:T5SS/PEP-CTERM-associated repeat protein